MGFNKLLADLSGRPVLWRTLDVFERCAEIDHLVVVSGGDTGAAVEGWKESGAFAKLWAVVEGGAERHLSVKNGLDALPDGSQFVGVHDGARPLISERAIRDCFKVARETGAASCAHPITDTLKKADASGRVMGGVDREGLWGMETPQVFDKDLLLRAYRNVLGRGLVVTDEVSALDAIGVKVQLVANDSPNPKITFEGDLLMAERLLSGS